MRIYLSSLILLLTFCSCTKEKKNQPKKIIEIYSAEDFYNKIKIIDTLCLNETNRAKEDIKKGKLTYNLMYLNHRPGYSPHNYFYEEGKNYIKKELAKFNINIDTTNILFSDIRSKEDNFFRIDCYQSYMKKEVEDILANSFVSIDTLIRYAEKQYVLNHPDKIFSLEERDLGYTTANNYFENFNTKSRIIFEENFVYPKDYRYKTEKSHSYTTADFILMKDGTIKNLRVESTFQNTHNYKFKKYFEKEMWDFVLKTKWIHPKYSGLIANSEMSFIFWHK